MLYRKPQFNLEFLWMLLFAFGVFPFLLIKLWQLERVSYYEFQARSQLKEFADFQQRYFNSHGKYSDNPKEFTPRLSMGTYTIGFTTRDYSQRIVEVLRAGDREAVETLKRRMSSYCIDCKVNPSEFRAIAVANLDQDAVFDAWTINHKNELIHLVRDLEIDMITD